MENQYDYCFIFFKTKYILKRHIYESKKCLKLKKKNICVKTVQIYIKEYIDKN